MSELHRALKPAGQASEYLPSGPYLRLRKFGFVFDGLVLVLGRSSRLSSRPQRGQDPPVFAYDQQRLDLRVPGDLLDYILQGVFLFFEQKARETLNKFPNRYSLHAACALCMRLTERDESDDEADDIFGGQGIRGTR